LIPVQSSLCIPFFLRHFASHRAIASLRQIAKVDRLTKPHSSPLAFMMQVSASVVDPHHAASILRWWRDSGVDILIDENPNPWLGRATKQAAQAAPTHEKPAETRLPNTLATLTNWLALSDDLPVFGPVAQRLKPFGTPGAPLMVLTDMPDTHDLEAGTLLSGDVGLLFDRMLAAIGLTREAIYCAPLSPGRPPTGQLDEDSVSALGTIARHHIHLASPKIVWLLGQSTSRAVLGVDLAGTQTKLQNINQEGVIVNSVASLHPRLLLQHPKRKAKVWADMQMIVGGLNS
jgi:uracil-DNA glycosylase